jgi:hypothetical protein
MSCNRVVNLDRERGWTLTTASGGSANVGRAVSAFGTILIVDADVTCSPVFLQRIDSSSAQLAATVSAERRGGGRIGVSIRVPGRLSSSGSYLAAV